MKGLIMIELLIITCFQQAASKTVKFSENINLRNTLVSSAVIQKTNAENEVDCIRTCVKTKSCVSAGYRTGDELCYTYNTVSTSGTYQQDWKHYVKDGLDCPVVDGYFYDPVIPFCVKLYTTFVDHPTAEDLCRRNGSSLVRIDSPQKLEIVVNYIVKDVELLDKVYIQGTRSNSNAYEWVFDNGDVMTYLPWNDNQPGSSAQTALQMNTAADGRFHDSKPYHQFPFMCEK